MTIDILVVSSPGGHLNTARQIVCEMSLPYSLKYVVHDSKTVEIDGYEVINIIHSDRDWRIIIQLLEAIKIIFNLKPKVILSTGAGIAIPFSLVAKLTRCQFIHVETFSAAEELSLSGKIISIFANHFFVRYEKLARKTGFIYVE